MRRRRKGHPQWDLVAVDMPLDDFIYWSLLHSPHQGTMAAYPYILTIPRRQLKFLLKEFPQKEFFEIE